MLPGGSRRTRLRSRQADKGGTWANVKKLKSGTRVGPLGAHSCSEEAGCKNQEQGRAGDEGRRALALRFRTRKQPVRPSERKGVPGAGGTGLHTRH